jgi:methyltransferase (TIGR00027 family)
MSSPIQDVSDTAFWIAHHRKLETERADALFRDPFAAKLAGDRGQKISDAMPTSRMVAWVVAIRTPVIDEFLRSTLESGVDTVLCLGAGLDARPYRMQLPPSLHWIEADYGRVIEYKEQLLQADQPHCRLERVKIDLADRESRRQLFTRVAAQARKTLVLTEGVIPYLSNDEVASLADDLLAICRARFWIVDYSSPQAQTFRRRRRFNSSMGNAPFKFNPGDWFGFFKQHGWQTKHIRYLPEEGERWGRPFPMPGRWRLLIALTRWLAPAKNRIAWRRFSGFALLQPAR